MAFLTGRVTYLRYRVDGLTPGLFGPNHLDLLSAHAIGIQKIAAKDGTEVGWIAGEDILDLGFDLAKNVVNDTLHFALRIDTQKLPADLLRAYNREELKLLAAENPSGRPSAVQKKEARELARERLEAEGKDGRFIRRKVIPLLWDGQANQVFVGTISPSALDHVHQLFQETFGHGLTLLDAGQVAATQVGTDTDTNLRVDLRPVTFGTTSESTEVAWIKDVSNQNYLGNEFLLWLWCLLETEGDLLRLADDSEVTVMLTRTLLLECPKGQSGSETIRSIAPTKLPEARRAIQAGKLPRQAGLILVRHEQQYELTLQAETLAVSGAKLPPVEDGEGRIKQEERVSQVRHLMETTDLLYGAYLQRRLGADWPTELERMRRWLHREERDRLAVSA